MSGFSSEGDFAPWRPDEPSQYPQAGIVCLSRIRASRITSSSRPCRGAFHGCLLFCITLEGRPTQCLETRRNQRGDLGVGVLGQQAIQDAHQGTIVTLRVWIFARHVPSPCVQVGLFILRTGVLEAFLFPRDTGNRTSLPARMFRQSVLELQEAHRAELDSGGLPRGSESSTSHGPLTGKPSGTAVEAAR